MKVSANNFYEMTGPENKRSPIYATDDDGGAAVGGGGGTIGLPQHRNVQVAVRWATGRPAINEIAMLRELVPELASEGITSLHERLRNAPDYVVGTFYPYQAALLREKAVRIGLNVVLDTQKQS